MFCPSCKKDVEPGLDKETLKNKEVVATSKARCSDCKTELPVNFFMMKTLKTLGQFYSQPTVRAAFAFECKKCDKVLPAVLSKDRKQAVCSECASPLGLSDMMIKAMSIAKNGSIDSQG